MNAVLSWLSGLLFTTVRTVQPVNGNLGSVPGPAPAGQTQVSDFITLQSLGNFSVMTVVITGIWQGLLQGLLGSGFDSTWWALALCLLYGLASMGFSRQRLQGFWPWASASIIALFNSLLLFGAVIGVDQGITTVA